MHKYMHKYIRRFHFPFFLKTLVIDKLNVDGY